MNEEELTEEEVIWVETLIFAYYSRHLRSLFDNGRAG